jgi:hypothetical protein
VRAALSGSISLKVKIRPREPKALGQPRRFVARYTFGIIFGGMAVLEVIYMALFIIGRSWARTVAGRAAAS